VDAPAPTDDDSLGHLNLVEFSRESTRWGVGGSLAEIDGVVLFATGAWIPVDCNGAFRLDSAVDPRAVIRHADEFFGRLGRGYSVRVRADRDRDLAGACVDAGLVAFGEPIPHMVCSSPRRLPALDGVEISPVTTPDELADFTAVNADAYGTYGMPSGVIEGMFSRPRRFLDAPHVMAFVARRGGVPESGALTMLSHGVAGVYWVGTVEAARGKGLGEAVAATTTNAALARGARFCTLQASVMGAPVYRRMGYRSLYEYRTYVRWRPPRAGAVLTGSHSSANVGGHGDAPPYREGRGDGGGRS
jgi:GNAT superfamily N-acetyltransferase